MGSHLVRAVSADGVLPALCCVQIGGHPPTHPRRQHCDAADRERVLWRRRGRRQRPGYDDSYDDVISDHFPGGKGNIYPLCPPRYRRVLCSSSRQCSSDTDCCLAYPCMTHLLTISHGFQLHTTLHTPCAMLLAAMLLAAMLIGCGLLLAIRWYAPFLHPSMTHPMSVFRLPRLERGHGAEPDHRRALGAVPRHFPLHEGAASSTVVAVVVVSHRYDSSSGPEGYNAIVARKRTLSS